MTTQTANPTRTHRLRRAFTAAVLTAGLALLAAPVAPAQAGNPPPPRSEYYWGICKVGTSKCPVKYNPPKWLGRGAERAGQVLDGLRGQFQKAK